MDADPGGTSRDAASREPMPRIVRLPPGSDPGPVRPRRPPARGSTAGVPRPRAVPAELEVRVDPGAGRLTLAGRLVAGTTSLLHDGVSELLRGPRPDWTLDVGAVTYLDSAGLRALSGAYRRALRHGRRVTLDGAPPSLQHVLTLMRLDRHLLPEEGPGPPADRGPGSR
ncbi:MULTISPECIES: STAS domain-containing protein [unclassified Blastococcus]